MSNSPTEELHAHLLVVGGMPPAAFALARGASVAGRAPGLALVLPSMEISRQHCRFEWDGEICEVSDLGSTRGTFVNGTRIDNRVELEQGDKIAVGSITLQFNLGEAPVLESEVEPHAKSSSSVVYRGEKVSRIPIEGELTLGRDPHADVWLNDSSVSRRHATVHKADTGCIVTDLQSTAGTFLNGHRFDSQALTVGDRLHLGPFCFQFDGQALLHIGAPQGASVTARNVTCLVGERVLLDEVSFEAASSQFVGILGPSGAGKSTLLHSLAGLEKPDAGSVSIDGEEIYAGPKPAFGYVPQEDIVHRELTVSQALQYGARLRLPAATPRLEIQRLVLQTMEQLGLVEHAAKRIDHLSGGQRKRVSVGVELLAKPSVLFLDEPSSGLDPATEFHLMELLRDLADAGCTIICTTHVVENAYLMDQLLVLVGGAVAFQGDAQEARSYFGVSKLVLLYDRLQEQPASDWKEQYQEHAKPALASSPKSPDASLKRVSARPSFSLPVLLARQWSILAADWRNFAILLVQPLIIAALVAWATRDQDLALFFTYIATLWFGCSNGAQEIVKERAIFQRERLVGVGTHSYLASKFLFLFGTVALQGILMLGTLRLLYGGGDGLFALQTAAVGGTALASVGIGCGISALARSPLQAVLIVPLVLIPQILLSGFTVKAWEMQPAVRAVSTVLPAYAARTLADTSFLLHRKLDADYVTTYTHVHSNLNPRTNGSRLFRLGDVFTRTGPAWTAAATLVAWAVAMYGLAWMALRRSKF